MAEVIIMKFGGSCLTNPESMNKVINILKKYKDNELIFVASALSGITDKLIKATNIANEKQDYYSILMVYTYSLGIKI